MTHLLITGFGPFPSVPDNPSARLARRLAAMPHLRHLDLGAAQFDATDLEVLTALAESPILPQLETLVLRSLKTDDDEEAAALMGSFAHLELSTTH